MKKELLKHEENFVDFILKGLKYLYHVRLDCQDDCMITSQRDTKHLVVKEQSPFTSVLMFDSNKYATPSLSFWIRGGFMYTLLGI